jgi:hypothetical protein
VTDTINWLETIGGNAALRHASTEELMQKLEHLNASDALKAAVKARDSSLLCAEFGYKPMRVNINPHGISHEEST